MSDSALANGKHSGGTQLTEEQYRELCKQVKQYQMKAGGKKKAARVMGAIETVPVKREVMITRAQVNFENLPIGASFSRDDKGHVLYVKNGKDRVRCLNTGKSESITGGSVYQVFL